MKRFQTRNIFVASVGLPTSTLTAVALMLMAFSSIARAQFVVMEAAPASNENPQNTPGFQIPVDDSLATSFSDFERHSKRGDWEQAFRSLSEIPSDKRQGMLRASRGMIVPAGHRIWEATAELPADGREAFRVFFDAKARKLWEAVGGQGRQPSEDQKVAHQVYEEYFLTSVGDDAANYLGEVAFEQGDFIRADQYWKAVLDHHPNSEIGELNLQVKRAIALQKLGRTGSFDALVKNIAARFADQTVTLGGADVSPVTFLNALHESAIAAGEQATNGSTDTATTALDGPLADDTATAWKLKYLSDQGQKILADAVTSNSWYRNGMETWMPPFATVGNRIVCNWFGIIFAIDARTGKLLWRSGKFDTLHSKFAQLQQSSANLEQYDVAASGDTVVALWLNPERLNYWQEPYRLIAYEAATGTEKWSSEKVEPLKEQSFVGRPLVTGNDVLVTSHNRNDAKLMLRSLKLADGSENWTAELGTAQQSQSRRGNQVMPLPRMQQDGQTLFILTNNGAVLSFDLRTKQLNWALKYDTEISTNTNRVYYSGDVDDATLLHTYGVLLKHEGLIYLKEADGREIHAIDPAGPKLLWSRPIAAEAVLVGVDERFLYILSRELMAIDRETQKLVWSRRLPIEGGGLSAVISDETVYVCSPRGIYCLDRNDGRLQHIFRGEDVGAIGAWIDIVGDRLISVSNTVVTAYEIGADQSTEQPQAP